MKHYILDTFNVINKINLSKSRKKDAQTSVSVLIELIKNYQSKYPSYRFTLVCDGRIDEPINLVGKIQLVNSGNQSADTIIKQIIDKEPVRTNLVVVSSDLEVYAYAKAQMYSVLTAENFLKFIEHTPQQKNKSRETIKEKPYAPSKREIEEYKKLFGVENE